MTCSAHQPAVNLFHLVAVAAYLHRCPDCAGHKQPLLNMLNFNNVAPEAQLAAARQANEKQAIGSNAHSTSGLPPNLCVVQRQHVSQAAEAHQELSCARCRDLPSVRALKACNTAPPAAQPAALTAAKSVATSQHLEPAATATAAASHAAKPSAIVPAATEATTQPAAKTDARAMVAMPASTHLTPASGPAARMVITSDVVASKPAHQSVGAESAGAESPGGSQPGPLQRSNSRKKRRKTSLLGGCNDVADNLQDQPNDTQPGPVERTVSSKRREKEKRRLAGAFSSTLGIMRAFQVPPILPLMFPFL